MRLFLLFVFVSLISTTPAAIRATARNAPITNTAKAEGPRLPAQNHKNRLDLQTARSKETSLTKRERKSITSPAGNFIPEPKSIRPRARDGSALRKKPKRQAGEKV